MPGLLVAVQVAAGAEVALGQPLIIMEAMKMQMEIRAPRAGRVRQVHVTAGEEITGGRLLVTLE
jgi:3-methylcrotonyl-CoA carboxylase alpha subunit